MANIEDYLDWRGDIDFDTDPFNEVDNLILAELSYTDFEGIIGKKVQSYEAAVPIADVCEKYFSIHTKQELEERVAFYKRTPLLLEKLAVSKRFADMRVTGYVNSTSDENSLQMSATTFYVGDGTVYVAFRGTDTSLAGWREDFNLSFLEETPGQKMAVKYMNRSFRYCELPIRVGGHSKGGNFAVYASAFCDKSIRKRILKVYSNDGPGFLKSTTERKGYREIVGRIHSYMPEESIVGVLLSNEVEHIPIKSSGTGIGQHDALTWQVIRNHFVYADRLTDETVIFDKTMQEWLGDMTDDDRKLFVNMIFSVLDATGAHTYSDLYKDKMGSLAAATRAIANVPKEKQKEFTDMVKKLLRTSGKVIGREVKKNVRSVKPLRRQVTENRVDNIAKLEVASDNATSITDCSGDGTDSGKDDVKGSILWDDGGNIE